MTSPALASIARKLATALGTEVRADMDARRLQSMIDARCRALDLTDAEAYLHMLESLPQEIDALIDMAVVRETRFFRDAAVFDHIRLTALALAAEFPGVLRILSAPCSTGQEAYSLAATLLAAGLPLDRFLIDAFDISPAALAVARSGAYPEAALRGLREELRQSLGTVNETGLNVHEDLRARIRFERRNLALPNALGTTGEYHLVLSRNLFIYLAPAARETLARSLSQALVPGGRLVIGTADRVEELSALFAPAKPASSFSFTLRQFNASTTAKPARSSSVTNPAKLRRSGIVLRPASPTPDAASPMTAASLYQRAHEDERQGEFRRAERRCRQALYLDPRYLPALELLQTLWRHQPSMRLRRALEDRIARVRITMTNADQTREEVA